MKLSIIALFLLIFNSHDFSQVNSIMKQFEYRLHTFDTTLIPYRIFIPSQKEKNAYPLIIALHGSGERGNDNEVQIKYNSLASVWADSASQATNPCFVIAPQCPKENKWVDSDWELGRFDFKLTPISNELDVVNDLIEETIKNFPIDKSRIYVTGLSMGGYGAWYMLMKYPTRFAAAIILCGGSDPQMACEISHIPIWDFHGDIDKTVPVEGSRLMVGAFGKCGKNALLLPDPNIKDVLENEDLTKEIMSSDLIYTEYKNKGHAVWNESYQNPLVRKWFFSKRIK